MRLIIKNISVFLIAALLGALGYVAYIEHYAYKQAAAQLGNLQAAISSAPLFNYGIIDSVNASSSSFMMHFARGDTTPVQILAPEGTYIARQDMLEENGVYTAITAAVPATINDIRPGDSIAAVINRNGTGTFSALVVLFGNPL